MGLPPIALKTLRDHLEQCRGLLKGEEVLYRDGKRERWVRFLHPDRGYINLKHSVPIYIAANGPKALETVGELGDGWITTLQPPESLRQGLDAIHRAARGTGRNVGDFYVTALTTACVTRPGEAVLSARVIERVGPFAIIFHHALWERSVVAANVPQELRPLYRAYEQDYVAKLKTPEDRRYLEVHEGHLIYLKPGEEKFLNEHLIKGSTLTGPREEIVARLKALEAAGLKNIAIQVVSNGRELIEEVGKEIIARYR
jgi:alkanesulfonate monooxygenase SsuD/methylene tetrahydromethanopterin reductase-like flavin-dependent oxidoreductase (luciferase family)